MILSSQQSLRSVGFKWLGPTLAIAVYFPYLSGSGSPDWDFWAYLAIYFAYWDQALVSPFLMPGILPYQQFGFPWVTGIQHAPYFIPHAVLAVTVGISSSSLAALQGLSIAVGARGMYEFAVSSGARNSVAALASVGFLFVPTHLSNASHHDIAMASALMPWCLWALFFADSPIRRLVGTIILWQFLLIAYPGVIIAIFFSVGVEILLSSLLDPWSRTRQRIRTLAIVVIPAVAMAQVKWTPLAAFGALSAAQRGELASLTSQPVLLTNFLALVFPFDDSAFSYDVTMRSWYIPSVILVAILLFGFQRRSQALLLLISSLTYSLLPILPAVDRILPSRVAHNDAKPIFAVAALALGALVLTRLAESRNRTGAFSQRTLVLGGPLLLGLAASAGVAVDLTPGTLLVGMFSLLLGVAVLVSTPYLRHQVWAAGALVVIVVTGLQHASAVQRVWLVDREQVERFMFQLPQDELQANAGAIEVKERAARTGSAFPRSLTEVQHNSSALSNGIVFSRTPSSMGYTNLKASSWHATLATWAIQDAQSLFLNGLMEPSWARVAPSRALDLSAYSTGTSFESTASTSASIVVWSPSRIVVSLDPEGFDAIVFVNELGYPGWEALSCNVEGFCVKSPALNFRDPHYLAAAVPEGTSRVVFQYVVPGARTAFLLFLVGLLLAVAFVRIPPQNCVWPESASRGRLGLQSRFGGSGSPEQTPSRGATDSDCGTVR